MDGPAVKSINKHFERITKRTNDNSLLKSLSGNVIRRRIKEFQTNTTTSETNSDRLFEFQVISCRSGMWYRRRWFTRFTLREREKTNWWNTKKNFPFFRRNFSFKRRRRRKKEISFYQFLFFFFFWWHCGMWSMASPFTIVFSGWSACSPDAWPAWRCRRVLLPR